VHELLQARPHRLDPQRGAYKPHTAVDVEADAARRDHAVHVVHGRHAADRKAVAPVDVRHGDARLDDPRQGRHVDHLPERLLVSRLLEQLLRGVHDAGHAHLALLGYPPRVLVDGLDLDRRRSLVHPLLRSSN
jgi:hypothetical protein